MSYEQQICSCGRLADYASLFCTNCEPEYKKLQDGESEDYIKCGSRSRPGLAAKSCGRWLPPTAFRYGPKMDNGLRIRHNICQDCQKMYKNGKERAKYRTSEFHRLNQIYRTFDIQARAKNIPRQLSEDFLLRASTTEYSEISGLKLEDSTYEGRGKQNPNMRSIAMKDNSLGWIDSNTVVVTLWERECLSKLGLDRFLEYCNVIAKRGR